MYRDALPTMIDRWRRLEAEVREKVGRVERRGWRWLPGETRALIGSLRERGSRPPARLDEALAAIDALERCRAAVDDALEAVDDPARPWNQCPAECPAVPFPWMRADDPELALLSSAELDDEARRALVARVAELARRLDPGFVSDAVHLPGARARFRVEGAPMVLDVWSVQGAGFWSGPRVEVGLLTTARRSSPRLVLRPEAAAGLGRSGRSAVTGNPDFDGRFVWEGEPGATETLLHPELQRGLRVVSLDDVPTLTVDGGLASLRWSFAPTARSVGAAAAVLLSVRDRSPARAP
ncbi:MAG: hypothetical protein JWM10_4518 [Myxococcaceae bacterium]|nr:hypothetical protein [Myxococcaceae bacterium]